MPVEHEAHKKKHTKDEWERIEADLFEIARRFEIMTNQFIAAVARAEEAERKLAECEA